VHSMTKKIKNDRDYKNLVEQLNEIWRF
jgi:hypothetical protein